MDDAGGGDGQAEADGDLEPQVPVESVMAQEAAKHSDYDLVYHVEAEAELPGTHQGAPAQEAADESGATCGDEDEECAGFMV